MRKSIGRDRNRKEKSLVEAENRPAGSTRESKSYRLINNASKHINSITISCGTFGDGSSAYQ